MTAGEKKMIDKNLDLIFEFEKYVLEHPELAEKIPRDAVVFMKVAGDRKVQPLERALCEKAGREGRTSYFGHGPKIGSGSFANQRTYPGGCRLTDIGRSRPRVTFTSRTSISSFRLHPFEHDQISGTTTNNLPRFFSVS